MSFLLLYKFSVIVLPNNLCMVSYLLLSSVAHRKLLKPPGTWPPRTWHGLCPGQPRQPRWAQWPYGEDLRPVLGFQGWAEKETSWCYTHPHPLPTTGRASFLALLFWTAMSGLLSPWHVLSLMCTTLLENIMCDNRFQATIDKGGSSYLHYRKVSVFTKIFYIDDSKRLN